MKISICMITYNHEAFIAQAIESVLMQECDIPYELVIGEDQSPDGTRAICERYAAEYPDKIKLLPALGQNIGAMNNFIQTLEHCDGDFLAILEGDDYWTHPQKLQMQVDFLRDNPDYVGCFTDYEVIRDNQHTPYAKTDDVLDTLTLEQLLRGNRIATCTIMYRNHLHKIPLSQFKDLTIGDWTTHILHAQYGHLKFLDVLTGAYRIHTSNYYVNLKLMKKLKAEIAVLDFVTTQLGSAYFPIIQQQLRWRYFELFRSAVSESQYLPAIAYFLRGLQNKPLNSWFKTMKRLQKKLVNANTSK